MLARIVVLGRVDYWLLDASTRVIGAQQQQFHLAHICSEV